MLDFHIAAIRPLFRMGYHAGTHHIQINIGQALPKMFPTLNRRGMVTVFPEGAAPFLPPIVLLADASGRQLHRRRYDPASFPLIH